MSVLVERGECSRRQRTELGNVDLGELRQLGERDGGVDQSVPQRESQVAAQQFLPLVIAPPFGGNVLEDRPKFGAAVAKLVL